MGSSLEGHHRDLKISEMTDANRSEFDTQAGKLFVMFAGVTDA